MNPGSWHIRSVAAAQPHRVAFAQDVFHLENPTLAAAFASPSADRHEVVAQAAPAKTFVVLDENAAAADFTLISRIEQRFARGDLPPLAATLKLPGGEASKNDPAHLDTLYRAMLDCGIDRRSYVLAIGGGALLDTAGYAAATMHRGVRLIRLPTTTLAQCDSGVGVKNAVNRFGVKNATGTFAVPWAVVNDSRFLRTLPDDVWRHGFAEVVKVALLKDAELFCWLEEHADALACRDEPLAEHAWQRSAALHLQHIAEAPPDGGGDPFEADQARPLDFGHWAAHRLEELTENRLAHGPAVSIGLALDLTYAARLGLLDGHIAGRAIRLLNTLGLPDLHPALQSPDLLDGLQRFQQHLGGRLTLTMIQSIGRPVEVHEIDHDTLRAAVRELSINADLALPAGTIRL